MTLARTSRSRPCPICARPDWCSLQLDDASEPIGVVCMRAESDKPTRNGGWYHRLLERDFRLPPRMRRIVLRPSPDWSQLVAERCSATRNTDLAQHAEALGVSIESLRILSCCVSPKFRGALLAPMRDASGVTRGIRLRYLSGRKVAVRGSREAVFAPDRLPMGSTLAIVEGLSDTAAGIDLAPDLDWLGRPSCTGAASITAEIVRERAPVRVVVVADRDEPGQRGAAALANMLRLCCADVRIVTPPAPSKDLRAAVRAGFTHDELRELIDATSPLIPARMVTA